MALTIKRVGGSGHRVDVIIPTRNRPDLTAQAVAAVQAQTYADWHLWVVDDASDDDTPERLDHLAASDDRISVLRRPFRAGANPARQAAFEASDAPLVATCDSDDLWELDKLARQVAAHDAEQARAGVVGPVLCWHDTIDEHGRPRGAMPRPHRSRRWHPFIQFNTSTPLLPRPLLEQAGGFAPTEPYPWRTTDHLDLFLRLTRRASFVVVPEVLVHCRHHPGARNSDGERTLAAAEEAEALLHAIEADLTSRPATRAWLQAAVAGRFLELGQTRRAAPFGRRALRAAGPATTVALIAHYGPWVARRQIEGLLSGTRTGRTGRPEPLDQPDPLSRPDPVDLLEPR